jgi:hypothetical protein
MTLSPSCPVTGSSCRLQSNYNSIKKSHNNSLERYFTCITFTVNFSVQEPFFSIDSVPQVSRFGFFTYFKSSSAHLARFQEDPFLP